MPDIMSVTLSAVMSGFMSVTLSAVMPSLMSVTLSAVMPGFLSFCYAVYSNAIHIFLLRCLR